MRPPVPAAGKHLHTRNSFNDAPLRFSGSSALAGTHLAVSPGPRHALDGITDLSGDFLAPVATFARSASSADLDVVAATLASNAGTRQAKAPATA